MNGIAWSLLLVPFVAGLLVLATHVPLGRDVLRKGIIFIDLAVAQVAALGVIAARLAEWGSDGSFDLATQAAAATAACGAALLLTWSGRRWPEIQEALIGLLFVFSACAGILLLSDNPHGGEHLKDLLAGQILWVGWAQLAPAAVLYAVLLLYWLRRRTPLGDAEFYVLFALAVTLSVQLVGVFLVFTSLIAPALASRKRSGRSALVLGYAIGALGYALGLIASALLDVPAGPAIAATLCLLALSGLRRSA
jgi:zinc/manganese transport system permease protein